MRHVCTERRRQRLAVSLMMHFGGRDRGFLLVLRAGFTTASHGSRTCEITKILQKALTDAEVMFNPDDGIDNISSADTKSHFRQVDQVAGTGVIRRHSLGLRAHRYKQLSVPATEGAAPRWRTAETPSTTQLSANVGRCCTRKRLEPVHLNPRCRRLRLLDKSAEVVPSTPLLWSSLGDQPLTDALMASHASGWRLAPRRTSHCTNLGELFWCIAILFTAFNLICTVECYDGNTARPARRSAKALGVRVTVARIAPSLLDLGRAATRILEDLHSNSGPDIPNFDFLWLTEIIPGAHNVSCSRAAIRWDPPGGVSDFLTDFNSIASAGHRGQGLRYTQSARKGALVFSTSSARCCQFGSREPRPGLGSPTWSFKAEYSQIKEDLATAPPPPVKEGLTILASPKRGSKRGTRGPAEALSNLYRLRSRSLRRPYSGWELSSSSPACGVSTTANTSIYSGDLCAVAPSWFETRSEIGSNIDTENCCNIRIQSWTGDRDEVHFELPKLATRNLDPRSAAIVDKYSSLDVGSVKMLQPGIREPRMELIRSPVVPPKVSMALPIHMNFFTWIFKALVLSSMNVPRYHLSARSSGQIPLDIREEDGGMGKFPGLTPWGVGAKEPLEEHWIEKYWERARRDLISIVMFGAVLTRVEGDSTPKEEKDAMGHAQPPPPPRQSRATNRKIGGGGGLAVRQLASNKGKLGSISSQVTPGFSQVGIVPRTTPLISGFSRVSPVSPAFAFRRGSILISFHPHRNFKTSLLRAGQILSTQLLSGHILKSTDLDETFRLAASRRGPPPTPSACAAPTINLSVASSARKQDDAPIYSKRRSQKCLYNLFKYSWTPLVRFFVTSQAAHVPYSKLRRGEVERENDVTRGQHVQAISPAQRAAHNHIGPFVDYRSVGSDSRVHRVDSYKIATWRWGEHATIAHFLGLSVSANCDKDEISDAQLSGRTPYVYKGRKSCKETCIAAERAWAAMACNPGHDYLPECTYRFLKADFQSKTADRTVEFSHNCVYQVNENHLIVAEQAVSLPELAVRCDISARGLAESLFFDGTVIGESYHTMLQEMRQPFTRWRFLLSAGWCTATLLAIEKYSRSWLKRLLGDGQIDEEVLNIHQDMQI
ncbi:hypothetical protein PR048_009411 [Dryococelus australis]|uniref:Uncharacterized protein n=1 Tax=Dryococelus australis TaxID=614101 RepID=A0ABQ9HZS9_9NEOP|nr:hypothetical protein PR048_009411 [Dryococelus australis]